MNYNVSNDMGFMEAVQSCFSQYANFNGRARRKEYWCFFAFNVLVQSILTFIGGMIFGQDSSYASILTGIYSLVIFIPGLAVAWRRLHDTGRSGFYYLFNLIPLIGQIILIVFFCQDSQPGENIYGENPKGIGNY